MIFNCECGHVDDEHIEGYLECQVDDCPCEMFEHDGEPAVD